MCADLTRAIGQYVGGATRMLRDACVVCLWRGCLLKWALWIEHGQPNTLSTVRQQNSNRE